MIRENILYSFLRVFTLLTLLGSCSLKEETTPSRLGGVEFVARHTDYNGKIVGTKAASVDDFENKIHNCYFLLFDNEGNCVYYRDFSDNLGDNLSQNTTASLRLSDLELGNYDLFTNCTACFVANIPANIINGNTTLEELNATVLDIEYSSVDIVDTGDGNKNSFFVVPEFDLDGNVDTKSVQCIPMFGMATCNLKSTDQCEIALKRLFAKISVNISVTQNLATFDLLAAHLYNLPTKVRLVEPTDPSSYESSWVKDASAFVQPQIEGPIDDDNIAGGAEGILSSSYKFYFYSPEYFLQPLSSNTENFGNEKYKPRMYDTTSKYPLYVKLYGSYSDASITGSSIGADVKYDLYLGEDASTSFTQKRNVHYTNNIRIKGITNNIDGPEETLDCRVEITTHDMVEIYGQTANCYIIGKTGTYIYPACKGVYKGGLDIIPDELLCSNSEGKTLALEVLKNDNTANKIENLSYNPDSKEFSFEITEMDGGTGAVSSNDGNIILGLKCIETGEIEWSWHIWIVNGALWGTDAFEMTTQTYPNGNIMMDRNLGAKPTAGQKNTAGVVTGLYYKYGRKEPYIDGAYWGGGESASYTWSGDSKSQTDPCPPGYRVPTVDVWNPLTSDITPDKAHSALYGAFQYWGEYYYPYSGYIDADGNLQAIGTIDLGDEESMAEVRLPHEQNPWGTTSSYGDFIRPTYPQKFLQVKYRINDIDVTGYSSARDEKIFKYWYQNKGYEIIECTFMRGTWKETKVTSGPSWFPITTYQYNASYTGSDLILSKKLTGEDLEKQYPTEYSNLIRRIQIIKAGDILNDYLNGVQKEVSSSIDESINTSYGYQVRCVRE